MQGRAKIWFGVALGAVFATAVLGQSANEIEQTADKDPNRIDITGEILSDTSADCADYAKTYVSEITDLQQGRSLSGAVVVTVNDDFCVIQSNGIPNHDVGGGSRRNFGSPVTAIGHTFNVARNPQPAADITPLTHTSYEAILLNGVVVDIQSAGCFRPTSPQADRNGNVLTGCSQNDPWLMDPMSPLAPFAEDDHHAHTQPDGRYHYHGNPVALFDDNPGPNGSPLIGFAADGFPVYGSFFKDETGTVRKAIPGFELKQGTRPTGDGSPGGAYDGLYRADYEFTGAGDLDECNGMTVNGTYGYYVTDSYPWIVACLRGRPDPTFVKPR